MSSARAFPVCSITTRMPAERGICPSRSLRQLLIAILVLAAPGAVAAPIQVEDARGRLVELARPAQRIVTLAPHFVENLIAIGALDQIVGTVDVVDPPPEAADLPSIGGHDSLSAEAILSRQPDLVLGWLSGNSAALLEQLDALGLPLFLEEPRALDDISAGLRRLGRLSGHAEAADRLASGFEQRRARLAANFAGRRPVKVFYQIWHEPLQTLNGEHVVSDLIRLCGGRNVFAEALPLAPQVGVEAVLAAAPEVIIASGQSVDAPPTLAQWRRWTRLPAVRGGHLYAIRPDWMLRYTPRMLDAAEQLCGLLERAR